MKPDSDIRTRAQDNTTATHRRDIHSPYYGIPDQATKTYASASTVPVLHSQEFKRRGIAEMTMGLNSSINVCMYVAQ